jgi:RHS repeat-associated protein
MEFILCNPTPLAMSRLFTNCQSWGNDVSRGDKGTQLFCCGAVVTILGTHGGIEMRNVGWPDAIGRRQASANYGTNSGTALSRPDTVPARSDAVLVTSTDYESTGNTVQTVDAIGMVNRFAYDDVGRVTSQIQNYQPAGSSSSSSSSSSSGGDCVPSADTNVTVLTAYNADGNVSTLTAVNPLTGNQITQYVYVTTLSDSGIATSTLKRKEIYPDSVDDDDVILFGYNRQSQVVQMTDQAGTVHEFDYDLLGRQTQDRVTAFGADVDDSVLRIETTFEVRGMKEHITSYDDATVGIGAVVNDCQAVYNDFGQLVTEYQCHDALVDPDSTPKIQYVYADGSAHTIRQTKLIYPNGRELTYGYGDEGSIDDAISRVASVIDDDETQLVNYSYLGPQTFVIADYAEPETKYTLIGTAGGNDPDTGDIYRGFDRFGRIKDSYWYNYGDDTDTDRIKYGYDQVGNRIWGENVVATADGKEFDELYQYDQVHRLKHMDRGMLSGTHTSMSSKSFAQCWTLDETGNWRAFKEDDTGDGTWDLSQLRSSNTVNEIISITESAGPSWFTPAYDAAGNMTIFPKPSDPTSNYTGIYDAWNRLVAIQEDGFLVAEYVYDGAKRRAIAMVYNSGVLFKLRHFYYTDNWRSIEERVDNSANASQQFVWGLRYVDDLVLRDSHTESDNSLDDRSYCSQDANGNVVGLIDSHGSIQERVAYSSYGVPLFLSPDWESQSDVFQFEVLFAGYRFDADTGHYSVRNRIFHSLLGTWQTRDPLETSALSDNDYQYCLSNPICFVDPTGEKVGDKPNNPVVPAIWPPELVNFLNSFAAAVDGAASVAAGLSSLFSPCLWTQADLNGLSVKVVSRNHWATIYSGFCTPVIVLSGLIDWWLVAPTAGLFPRTSLRDNCPKGKKCSDWGCSNKSLPISVGPIRLEIWVGYLVGFTKPCLYDVTINTTVSIDICLGKCC